MTMTVRVPAALSLLVGSLLLVAACDSGDDSGDQPTQGTPGASAAQQFPDDACETILSAVGDTTLGELRLADHQLTDGDTPTVSCTFDGTGPTRLTVGLTAYAAPSESAPSQVTADETDQACDALEAGGATVKRTDLGCETGVESTLSDARRIGSGSTVFPVPQDVAVAQLDLRLDVGPDTSPVTRAETTTAAQLAAVGFAVAGLDLTG